MSQNNANLTRQLACQKAHVTKTVSASSYFSDNTIIVVGTICMLYLDVITDWLVIFQTYIAGGHVALTFGSFVVMWVPGFIAASVCPSGPCLNYLNFSFLSHVLIPVNFYLHGWEKGLQYLRGHSWSESSYESIPAAILQFHAFLQIDFDAENVHEWLDIRKLCALSLVISLAGVTKTQGRYIMKNHSALGNQPWESRLPWYPWVCADLLFRALSFVIFIQAVDKRPEIVIPVILVMWFVESLVIIKHIWVEKFCALLLGFLATFSGAFGVTMICNFHVKETTWRYTLFNIVGHTYFYFTGYSHMIHYLWAGASILASIFWIICMSLNWETWKTLVNPDDGVIARCCVSGLHVFRRDDATWCDILFNFREFWNAEPSEEVQAKGYSWNPDYALTGTPTPKQAPSPLPASSPGSPSVGGSQCKSPSEVDCKSPTLTMDDDELFGEPEAPATSPPEIIISVRQCQSLAE